jgi:hypothetical protein
VPGDFASSPSSRTSRFPPGIARPEKHPVATNRYRSAVLGQRRLLCLQELDDGVAGEKFRPPSSSFVYVGGGRDGRGPTPSRAATEASTASIAAKPRPPIVISGANMSLMLSMTTKHYSVPLGFFCSTAFEGRRLAIARVHERRVGDAGTSACCAPRSEKAGMKAGG